MTDYIGGGTPLPPEDDDPLMTPGEVARVFRVDPKTVTRWAKAKRLKSIRTPGGHHRVRKSEVLRLLEEEIQEGTENE